MLNLERWYLGAYGALLSMGPSRTMANGAAEIPQVRDLCEFVLQKIVQLDSEASMLELHHVSLARCKQESLGADADSNLELGEKVY